MGLRAVRNLTLVAAAAVAISGCSQGSLPAAPVAEVSQASGDFAVSNSRNGQAIFRAQGLAPGRSITGTVRLTNTGSLNGELAIAQVDIRDRPGVNGGLLSQVLELAVEDVTRPNAAVTMFSGRLGELDGRNLGTIGAGQSKAYRFTATLPDHGVPTNFRTGDNAYIGSGVTVTYTWKATAPEPTGPSGAPRVSYRVVTKRRLVRRRRIDIVARCDRACRLTAWAKLPKPNRRVKRAPRTRKRTVTVAARKRVRIKLKVTRKQRRAIIRKMRRTRRPALRVYVRARATATGDSKTFSRRHALRSRRR
jgi:hypothetical protein